ncbi:hypothetical protein HMPREF9080_01036 [Cardiobacterium valvarum F0432]|uniref:Uncharacterized protein n=1 Tax=Cardiobacterium valvarum F0432 TaxID=797473 RepID=G9ZE52_9GAMM|nr:hypothetical protein HMPREF9080_01036 [Cardiobacterium valvarum F0432]
MLFAVIPVRQKAPRQLQGAFCVDTSSKARKHHGFAAFLCFAAVIKSLCR